MKIQRLNSFINESNLEKVLDLKDVFLELKDEGLVSSFKTSVDHSNSNIKITIILSENIFSNIKNIDILEKRIEILKNIKDNLRRIKDFFINFSFEVFENGLNIEFSPSDKFKEFHKTFRNGGKILDIGADLIYIKIDDDFNSTIRISFYTKNKDIAKLLVYLNEDDDYEKFLQPYIKFLKNEYGFEFVERQENKYFIFTNNNIF